ncbi:MAG TPA: hypothetical protein VNI01_08660 [Elusimicrobiota bacterium]|jgi:hypothetical protein|nr:hypothetical protein [Elusimicrobiota bacterium]
MDLFECLLEDHRALRGAYQEVERRLGAPAGVGWSDQRRLDKPALDEALRAFRAALHAHAEVERVYLERTLRQVRQETRTAEVIDEACRLVESMLELCCSVSSASDGQHLHALRATVRRLGANLELHLGYEEKELFPRMAKELSPEVLAELGRRATLRGGGAARAATSS